MYKKIIINDLPDCYAKTQLIELVQDPAKAMVCVGVRLYHIGDWTAYIGFPSTLGEFKPEYRTTGYVYYCNNVSSYFGVLSWGDKLEKSAAEAIFPELVELNYRS